MSAAAELADLLRMAHPVLSAEDGRRLDAEGLVDILRRLAEQFDGGRRVGRTAPPRRMVVDPGGFEGALIILASVFSAPTAVIPSGHPHLRSVVLEQHRPNTVVDAVGATELARRVLAGAARSDPYSDSLFPFERGDGQLLLPTSGTTGEPKVVVLRAAQLLLSARNVAVSLALGPTDTTVSVMPLSHVHGLVASVLAPLVTGGSVIVAGGFRPAAVMASIDRNGANWITAVPSLLELLLHESLRTGWLPARPFRFLRSASSSLPPSLLERLEERFGCPVVEAYGMTEAAHEIASNRPDERTPGSVGRASGCTVGVLDEHSTLGATGLGEIAIRGVQVTHGYLGATPRADDAWLRTGDLGWIDGEGRIWIHGRSKDVINRSGETIAPRAVEDALLRMDVVVNALTFSVPHDHHGEVPAALVVTHENQPIDERSLRHGLLTHLHHRHVPVGITRVDGIPLGRTGKPDRQAAAQRFLDQWPRVEPVLSVDDAAQTAMGERVAAVWSTLFGREIVDDESFVGLGGDSLLAVALVALYDEAGLPLTILDFATSVTIKSHAALAIRISS